MSHPADDQRILTEIERRLTHDDPALAARMSTLNQQFPGNPAEPAAPAIRRNPRFVVAVVLSVIALLALMLTAVLNAPPTPPADGFDRPTSRSAAMAMHAAP
ncbi:DUF3040 domain-containing protein [Streptomyces sp. NPDC006339]|uniref:DUF3040 domain-containing protein n=1 Tax=Streptomyces sp. NPDC006339 TaxID=3156755 RepID=UPI0033B0C333